MHHRPTSLLPQLPLRGLHRSVLLGLALGFVTGSTQVTGQVPSVGPTVREQCADLIRLKEKIAAATEEGDFDEAKEIAEKLVEAATKCFGESHWRTTDARLTLGTARRLTGMSRRQRDEWEEIRRLRYQADGSFPKWDFAKAKKLYHVSVERTRKRLPE